MRQPTKTQTYKVLARPEPTPIRQIGLGLQPNVAKIQEMQKANRPAEGVGALIDWKPYLSPGENAVVLVLAADRRQARVIFKYAAAMLRAVPPPAGHDRLIERETAELAVAVVNNDDIRMVRLCFCLECIDPSL
jgi:hypothetical protein